MLDIGRTEPFEHELHIHPHWRVFRKRIYDHTAHCFREALMCMDFIKQCIQTQVDSVKPNLHIFYVLSTYMYL